MINVLIVSHGAALGGSPISALNIGRFIDKQNFNPIFVFGENGPIVEIAKKEGFKTYIIKKRGFLNIPMMIDFYKLIKKEKIDLVHLNTFTSYYKYPAIVTKFLNKRVVWFARENPEEKRCVRLANYINKYADKIVTVSYDTANHMYYANKHKLITIHNGINLDFCKKTENPYEILGLDKKFEYITTIASIEKRKGIIELIESFNLIKDKIDNNIKLLIVGKDRTKNKEYLKKVKNTIKKYNLDKRIILYGESKNIKEIMQITKVFVLNAYWEGLSRVLLEALICAKPIVTSKNGGNKEQVFDGINGYTFEAGNIEELSQKLLKILNENLAKFGANSKQTAIEKFDIKKTTNKIENLYKSLI